MAEGDRLGDLQMGIARHHRGRVAFGLFDQGMLQRLELSIMPIDGVANPKAKIRRDLIVARSGGMQPPRRGTNQIGQSAFDIHMNIFERVLEDKIPGLNLAQDLVEAIHDRANVGCVQDALLRQHRGMGL